MTQPSIKQLYVQAQDRWAGLFIEYARFAERLGAVGGAPVHLKTDDLYLALGIEKGLPAVLSLYHAQYHDFARHPKGFEALSDRDRLLVQLRHLDGLTNREISLTVAQTREYNVSRWLGGALRKLSRQLRKLAAREARRGAAELEDCLELIET